MVYELWLLLAEVVLSAYPLLIKLVDATVFFQVGLRMVVYTVLALGGMIISRVPFDPTILMSRETIATGLLNLMHVGTSYTAFEQLAAGNAMALFYTYPVFNLLGAALVFGEQIPLSSMPWIGLALIGTILLAQPTSTNWTMIGVASALLAALTETGIYLWFKSHKEDESDQPYSKMVQMYGSSGAFWLIGAGIALAVGYLKPDVFAISSSGLGSIVMFNSLVGFAGYALRFYLIPKVSTVAFSALSFVGVISAYLLGWMFTDEVPSLMQGVGAAAIIAANAVLLRKENA
jgi:drug/metabolite transporter (DMT)-like permease